MEATTGEYGFLWGTKPKELQLKPVQLKLLVKVNKNPEAQNFNTIHCNPWISSAMVMAMSIYRTLCVLVFLKISLLEMLISFGNLPLTSYDLPLNSHDLP